MEPKKKVVTIGGGGGHSKVLQALKDIPNIVITGICPSTDSGGSTGILQREYNGNGFTGDLTKCMLALCDNKPLVDALSYRYTTGSLDTHSVKNLLLHALVHTCDTETALLTMRKILELGEHQVIPVTKEKTELCAELAFGHWIFGETSIDKIATNPLWFADAHSISKIALKPEVEASPEVLQAIAEADYIVICPGDLYTSVLPVLLPLGMKQALTQASAPVIHILNIMTKAGETDNYTAWNFVEKIEAHLGRHMNYLVYNNAKIPKDILHRYALERKVNFDSAPVADHTRKIPAPLALIDENLQIISDPEVIRQVLSEIIV